MWVFQLFVGGDVDQSINNEVHYFYANDSNHNNNGNIVVGNGWYINRSSALSQFNYYEFLK